LLLIFISLYFVETDVLNHCIKTGNCPTQLVSVFFFLYSGAQWEKVGKSAFFCQNSSGEAVIASPAD
jgi:hypothetical protein